MLDALRFKCNVLWAQLDALYFAYVAPRPHPARRLRPGPRLGMPTRRRRRRLAVRSAARRKFRFDEVRQAWVVLAPEKAVHAR